MLCCFAALAGLPGTAWALGAREPARLAQCSWDEPGHNPFTGDVVAAVDRYTDIPAEVRSRLKTRMAKRNYDDIALIQRDSIQGKARYDAKLRDMHFGVGRVCSTVSRQAWQASHQERGLVYCEGAECIIVPTVCRNVSRVKRDASAVLDNREVLAPEATPFADPLAFDAPGAGPLQWANTAAQFGFADNPPAQGDTGLLGAGPGGPDGRVSAAGAERLLEVPTVPGGPGLPLPSITNAVPEPQTGWLMLLGLVVTGVVRRTWRRRGAA